ncbi:MAG: hypothetical protein ABJB66_11300 [Gemmatimonadaceae bacterium]
MSWLATFGIAFLTAIVGCAGTVGLTVLIVDWYQVSGFEGGSGYLVVFMSLLAALISFIIGLICARVVAGRVDPSFVQALGASLGITASILSMLLVGFRLAADLPAKYKGQSLRVQAELRAPAGFEFPATENNPEWYAFIDTPKHRTTSRINLDFKDIREENGKKIIPIVLELNTSIKQKLYYVHLGEKSTELFVLAFGSPNASNFEWTRWLDAAWDAGKPQPPVEQRFSLRYRLATVKPSE